MFTGYEIPANKIVMGTTLIQELKVETAAGILPGRVVCSGATEDTIVISDGLKPCIGWTGYENADAEFMPTNMTTAFAVDAYAPVHSGAGALIKMPFGLAAKTVATKGDLLLSWGGGLVVPGVNLGGRIAVKIPFSKSTTEVSTVTIPAGVVVRDCIIDVVTNEASGTIDVGTLSTASGDAAGFLDGESLTTAGIVQHNTYDTTAANNTTGVLLVESDITGDVAAGYYSIPTGYLVPSGGKVLTYTTSDTTATVAGYIYLVVDSPGIQVVGKAWNTVSAASAAATVLVEI